jgi:hypothetical protein
MPGLPVQISHGKEVPLLKQGGYQGPGPEAGVISAAPEIPAAFLRAPLGQHHQEAGVFQGRDVPRVQGFPDIAGPDLHLAVIVNLPSIHLKATDTAYKKCYT